MAAPPPGTTAPPISEPSSPGTTAPPVSEPPTTQPPTTEPPTTQPPTTQPPTTEPPTTQPPTSEPPTTQPPTSEPPTTQPPSPTQPPSESASPTPTTPPPDQSSVAPSSIAPTSAPSSASSASSAASASSVSSVDNRPITSTEYVTFTDANGTVQTSAAAAANKKGTNTGAIVGGVVGGVVGAALIAGLIWWLLRRQRRNRETAFDEKMFDPHHSARHSQADPLEHMAPSPPSVSVPGDGTVVDPYPYEASHGGYDNAAYDPYTQHAQSQMQMPDARDYMGYNYDSPYAAASYAGVGAGVGAGAGAAAGLGAGSAAAAAKHREAMGERAISPETETAGGSSRPLSSHYGGDEYQSAQGHEYYSAQGHEAGPHSPRSPVSGNGVYQHTDSEMEIPPNYNDIRRE